MPETNRPLRYLILLLDVDGGRQWHDLDTTTYSPAELAADGAAWLGMGAQIVGGCCGTTPDHIAALRRVVPSAH